MAHHPEAAGAVVLAPGHPSGGEGGGLVALVGVDQRCEEPAQLAGVGHAAGQEVAEQLRGRASGLVPECIATVLVDQAGVDVAGRTRHVGGHLGHEGGRHPVLLGEQLGALLEHQVAVGHGQCIAVDQVDLVLAAAPLALGRLDRHPGLRHLLAQRVHQIFVRAGAQQVVVDDVGRGRLEVAVAPVGDLAVAAAEGVELELRGHLRVQAPFGQPLQLAAQHLARGDGHRPALVVGDVAQHQRAARQPRRAAQSVAIRLQHHVAVAGLPGGEGEAGQRLEFDVGAQQVIADVQPAVAQPFEVDGGRHPLAHQPAIGVGEGHRHRVQLVLRYQPFGIHRASHQVQSSPSSSSLPRVGRPESMSQPSMP